MSPEELATVRDAYDAFGRGDLDAVRRLLHPRSMAIWPLVSVRDGKLVRMYDYLTREEDLSRLLPDENVLHGRDQIRAYYDRMWETWSGFGWRPTEFVELGEGHYAAVARVAAEGRGSGTPVVSELTIFYEVVDGLVARAVFEPGRSPQLQG